MILQGKFLRSKVARRIFVLFMFCAMLPIAVLSFVSSRFVTHQLDEQSREQLQRTTKMLAMEMMGRLTVVESELRMAALVVAADPAFLSGASRQRVSQQLAPRVDRLYLMSMQEVNEVMGRPGATTAPVDASVFSPYDGPSAWLNIDLDASADEPQLRLTTAVDARQPERGYLVAEIKPGYLWDSELPPQTEMMVVGPDADVLYSSLGRRVGPPAPVLEAIARSSRGEFSWTYDGQRYRAHHWMLYLRPQYAHPGLSVVLSQPDEEVVAAIRTMGRILPVVVLLCFMVVLLLSLIMIRKSLIPIVSLQQGTRGIAAGRFDTRVTVSSNDEFRQLAESFNAMAARLGAQFGRLKDLAGIDRAILSTLEEDEIVGTLLSRLPEHLHCDGVAVVLVDPDRADAVRLRASWVHDPDIEIRESAILPPEQLLALSAGDGRVVPLARGRIPGPLAALFPQRITECLVLPLLRSKIEGWIMLCDAGPRQRAEEDLIEARRLADQVAVALANARLLSRLEQANWETLYSLARAVDANSPWTAGHSERVTRMAMRLGEWLELPQEQLVVLHKGGLLHDLGKIGVPGHIVDKPGKLTGEELALIRDHVRIGARILEPISAYSEEIPIVLYHHERYDGRGYPEGLRGEDIPYLARILAVADVYDALISERPYREAWNHERVIDFIREGTGTQFDPRIVGVFLEMMEGCSAGEQARPLAGSAVGSG